VGRAVLARCSDRTEYAFNEGKEDEFTAQLAVCRVFTTSRRTKRGKRRAEWLLFIMIALDWTPERCRQRYRKRFGVETSYRLGNKLLGWTTSLNPAYRFALIGHQSNYREQTEQSRRRLRNHHIVPLFLCFYSRVCPSLFKGNFSKMDLFLYESGEAPSSNRCG
jgi:hypothetical protein